MTHERTKARHLNLDCARRSAQGRPRRTCSTISLRPQRGGRSL